MKDNLSGAANIIHVLLNSSNRRNIWHVRRNTYKHPRWGFMYWLDTKGKEGPQLLYICKPGFTLDTLEGLCFQRKPSPSRVKPSLQMYGVHVYCWWHFLASTAIAFQDFAQWHCQGFLTLPPIISAALLATELCAAVLNFVLLYPTISSTAPVSSPASPHALSNLEESLAMPPAGATLLPSLQSSANSPPAQGLRQAPGPETDNWQPFSYKGWSKEEIQRHRQAFDPDYRQEEEMLYSSSEWL
ncbi:hypothetical protein BN14_10017 [Rhizoctonia solani AG-1 IB]|uniref:Uncharacterized protein n=1 Tax=Thanatephorus cucumeris (strain AG1-IB / isolate 7/3/14) TaxID=1108050 RepID=M5C8Z5_THACB|nr:hypothetical protein BN14_10017 [Rhizoctonia solani AG-1 IB]